VRVPLDGVARFYKGCGTIHELISVGQQGELNSRPGRVFLDRLRAQPHDAVSAFTGSVN
jgi:hypothetical protein